MALSCEPGPHVAGCHDRAIWPLPGQEPRRLLRRANPGALEGDRAPRGVIVELDYLTSFSPLRWSGGWSARDRGAAATPVTCPPPLLPYATCWHGIRLPYRSTRSATRTPRCAWRRGRMRGISTAAPGRQRPGAEGRPAGHGLRLMQARRPPLMRGCFVGPALHSRLPKTECPFRTTLPWKPRRGYLPGGRVRL